MSIASEIARISKNVSDSLDAVAAKGVTVPSGSNSDDLPDLIAAIQQGSGQAIAVTEEPDQNGGTIKNITAIDISSDTVDAAHLLYGYTAHDKFGESVTGEYVAPTTKTSSDVTVNGDTVTIPAGAYASQVTKTVASGSVTAPATISGSSATVSTGTNTLTLSKTVSVTPSVTTAGYVSSGTSGNSSVSLTASVNTNNSSSLSVSGDTVTAPAGYYAEAASKSVTTMMLPTSASASATSGYTSKATISRSTSDQYINIAPGYNSAGGYYKVSAVANGSVTAPSTISGSSATVSTGTNTLTLTKTVSVTPSVTTAGYISSGTAGNASVSLSASVTTKGTATFNTSSSNQTISSGTYITGTQTIRAVTTSGIDAANIKAGVTVKVGDSADDDRIAGVTGTYTSDATAAATDIVSGKSAYVNGSKVDGSLVIQHYYTGTSTPASNLGVNGDIYLKTS